MTNTATIQAHLERRFADQRVVCWSDPTSDFDSELAGLNLSNVEVVKVANDEFALKYRILRGEPETKFLVYRAGPVPADVDNWLLDLELAYGVFTADKDSLVARELGADILDLQEIVAAHATFFRSTKRTEALKDMLRDGEPAVSVRAKMIAVLCGQKEHRLGDITRALLRENAKGKSTTYDSIVKNGLDQFHWDGVSRIYGYSSENPGVDDFVLWLYRNAMNGFTLDTPDELRNIQLDFGTMRNDYRERDTFEQLSQRVARDLEVEDSIGGQDFRDLIERDLFDVVDAKIVTDLAAGVADRALLARDVTQWIRQRRGTFWFDDYKNLYEAIEAGANFLASVDSFELSMDSFDDGLGKYCDIWYQTDQLYRHFVYHARRAEKHGPLETLASKVEGAYSNTFLMPLGNAWQQQVDSQVAHGGDWASATVSAQTKFYVNNVAPKIKGGRNKICVIISDAMRYEIAQELGERIRAEDRYEAVLSPMLSTLPSYTQLGMAALLPHNELLIEPKKGVPVRLDGKSASGIANRAKALAAVGGTAVAAGKFLKLNGKEARQLIKDHQVLYFYHDRIDATGDSFKTEDRVFAEVEATIEELKRIVKKLSGANANNIVITADHGFLYQDAGLAESDYLSVKSHGDRIDHEDRRFTVGHALKRTQEFITLSSDQLGLEGEIEVQIPKSINRVRRPGAGSRFVHGGASLQEIVVPVLAINKKRSTDTAEVGVDILPESSSITTGQLSVKLLQEDPVADKILPRKLRANLYVGETLISNQVELTFDSKQPDKADRYETVQLILSRDADDFNNRTVEMRLDELIPRTNQWRTYRKAMYTLKRSIMTDFDA